MRSTKKGFTLVELLVVIAILAILATVSVVGYTAFIDRAHQSVAMQEMTQIRNALVAEDITNDGFDLSDGISGTHSIVVASTGEVQGAPTEAENVLSFVQSLGIAGSYKVAEGNLQFSPAGRDATATWNTTSNEISTSKGTVQCDHNWQEASCTDPKTCSLCGETEGEALGHTGGTATCSTQAVCTNCEEPYGYLADHSWEDGKCSACDAQFAISFANPADRTSLTDEQQVWEKYDITVTNNKASSTSKVADYSNPARFYKGSEIVVEYANMGKLVFNCNTAAYATSLQKSIGDTATVNEKAVTVEFAEATSSYTIALSDGQVRVDSIEVYTFVESEITPPVEPEHACESVCATCEGCLDDECTETACATKCSCPVEPAHTCQNPCDDCGKCTNAECEEAVCGEKCEGHEPVVSEHECESKCNICSGCKDASCGETACATKCAGHWVLVTDASTLQAGDQIVIVASNSSVALSTTQNPNNRGQASVTKSGETVTFGSDVQVITLEAGTVDGTFAFNTDSGYLYAASSSKNYLRTETNLSANSSWTVTITSEGVATIKAQGTNTRNWLRYNATANSGNLFSCYSSGQEDVSIYKLV